MLHKITKKLVILAAIIPAFIATITFAGAKEGWSVDEKERIKNVRNLLNDISTINLLNGLYLTEDQSREIMALAWEFKEFRSQNTISEDAVEVLESAEEIFLTLRAEIQKGAPSRSELPKQASQINKRLKELKEAHHLMLEEKYLEYQERLNSILTEEQLSVVDSFKRCLIPPKDLRDPVRAGQASSNSGMVRMLRRLRTMPEEKWQVRKYRIVSRYVDRINKNKFRMTDSERLAEKERILNLIEEIREMPDVDFELEKESLAEKVAPEDKIAAIKKKIEFRKPRRGRAKMPKAVRLLLSERIIPILEERLAKHAVSESSIITGEL
jgi:hypothetical protein